MDLVDSSSDDEIAVVTAPPRRRFRKHIAALDDDDSSDSSSIEVFGKRKPPSKPYARHKTLYNISDSDDEDARPIAPKPSNKKSADIPQKKARDSLLDDDSDSSFEKLLAGLKIAPAKDDDSEKEEIELTDPWATAVNIANDDNDGKKKPSAVPATFQTTQDDDDSSIDAASSSESSALLDDGSTGDNDSAWKFNKRRKEYTFSCSSEFPDFCIPAKLYDTLYDYQRSGVQFLASLHQDGIGGVLGDDMGMGKTYMTLTYLGGLMRAGTTRNSLIVAPVSVLQSWEKEARKVLAVCVPYVRIQKLSTDMTKKQRLRLLKEALSTKSPYLVITSYGMVREMTDDFCKHGHFDYVVLDEGHLIKNPKSLMSKACHTICRHRKTHRLLLSGTPIMNNLQELWSIFDWVTSGQVLGESKDFAQNYAKIIVAARDIDASDGMIRAGERANKQLQELVKPYFLQRLKADYLADKLPPKTELMLWTHLSNQQRSMYTEFTNAKEGLVRSILMGEKTSPLEAITFLKKLCGHPLLIEQPGDDLAEALVELDVDAILAQSSKLQILRDLVDKLHRDGHKTLVFSQSTRMLDIIQKVLCSIVQLARIDGSTRERDRQRFVDEFNVVDGEYDAMLLSTKAAGIGLTLTGADRVIVFDPSWTPAEDSQAVDRCYRIGQTKEVLVYRMIAAGTVEEKMYEKQIYKDGIRRTVFTEGAEIQRYFATHELKQLFTLGDPGVCKVMDKVHDQVADWSRQNYILSHRGVVGLSRHDGFYNPADAAIQEEAKAPVELTRTGRAQRVLLNSNANDEAVALGREIIAIKSGAGLDVFEMLDDSSDDNIPSSVFAAGKKSKMNSGSSDDKENTSKVARSTIFVDVFQLADEQLAKGNPRRSMFTLVKCLQDRKSELSASQASQLHRKIATLADSLGLPT